MQDHRETTNTPQTPSKAKPLLQRFLSSPVIVGSPLSSPTTTASRAPTVNYQERMSYQKQLSYQSISSSSSASSLSSTSSASLYPRPPRYSPVPPTMTTTQATSRSEALLRSTLLRDDRSSSPQPQASSSRIPIPSSSTTPASRPGHRRRHSYAVTPQSTRFMVSPTSRQGLDSVSGFGAAVSDGDEGREASEASLYMRANLIRRRSTNTGTPSDYTSDRSSTPRPQAMPHAPSSTTQNVYGGDAEVDLLSAAPQSSPFTSRIAKRQSASHITTTIITTSSSKRNSPTSCSPSPTKSTHKRATSPSPASKTGSIISSPRIQPSTVAQAATQRKRQSLPASLHSLPPPIPSAIPPLPNMHQLPVPPPTAFNATFPEPQPQQLTTQEIELRARLERVLQADKKAAKKAAKEAARRATSKSRSPMKGQRRLMSEEAGNSLRFINGDVYLTDDESDEEVQEESGIHSKAGGDESLEPSTMLGVGARERKVSMNEVRDEEGSCPWRNDTSTSTSSSSSSLPATAITPGIVPASVMSSPKIDYTAHMKSRTEGAPWTPRHQPPALPSSSPVVYPIDEAHAGKRPPPSPLVNPRTPRTQPPHVLPSPEAVGYTMTRAGSMSTRRRHTATFNPPAAPQTTSPRTRSASLVPSPQHQAVPLAYAGQRNPNTMPSFLPSQEEGVKQGMITPPPTPPHTMRSTSRSAAQQRAESLARNSPLVYGNNTYTCTPHVRNTTSSRRPDTGRSGSGSSSSSSEFDEGCLDEGYIPPLSLHENHDVDIVSSPDASADPSRPSYFVDQGISHSRRPPPGLTNSALFSGVSEEDAVSMASGHARHMTFSAPSHRPTFNARKASERLKSTEGYISFASVEGLGCPPEYLHGEDDDKKEDERGRKGWKGLPGLGWVFGGGASAAEV